MRSRRPFLLVLGGLLMGACASEASDDVGSGQGAATAASVAQCKAETTRSACDTCCGVLPVRAKIADCRCKAAKTCNAACGAAVCSTHSDGSSGIADPACDGCNAFDATCADEILTMCENDPSCRPILECLDRAACAEKGSEPPRPPTARVVE